MAAEEFPPIRTFKGVEPLIFPSKMLKNLFSKTSFAICTDQARHNLTGLLIEISEGRMTAVATDGRRMSLFVEEEGIVEGIEIKVIIPGKLIHELERLLDDENNVEVFVGENQAAFCFNSLRLVTALIEGNFPNYEMVIPKNHDKEALVSTEQFSEAMRRTCTMTNEKFNSVRVIVSQGSMNLKVVTPEVGEYEEDLLVGYDGDPVEIAFNPEFVLEVLRHIDPETTSLLLKDGTSPGVIKPHHEAPRDNYINVVMPIRL
jgi:DNA polymerase-3 subunit beta